MHTATWLIVLTMAVCFAVPFLLIMLTTYPPHPNISQHLLLATQFPIQHYIGGNYWQLTIVLFIMDVFVEYYNVDFASESELIAHMNQPMSAPSFGSEKPC